MATVFIPALMRTMTGGKDRVEIVGHNLRAIVEGLEAEFPGIKEFLLQDGRIRPGLALAVDGAPTAKGLVMEVPEHAEVHILPALGGG